MKKSLRKATERTKGGKYHLVISLEPTECVCVCVHVCGYAHMMPTYVMYLKCTLL